MVEKRELAAYLVTEPSAGSDVGAIRTTAARDGESTSSTGRSVSPPTGPWRPSTPSSPGPPFGGHDGLSFFLVERDTPGLSMGRVEKKLGQRGSNTAEVILDGVRVPAGNLLGEEGKGFLLAMKDFDMSRPAVGAQALGIAEGALEEMLRYAQQRKTFGKPLCEHQMIRQILADSAILVEASRHARERVQFGKPIAEQPVIQSMVADMATAVTAARLLTREAAALFDEGDARRGALFGGMAKTFASDTAMRVTTDAVQILGGYGYMKDHSVERMMRDAKLTQIYTGTNQITRLVTGRSLLLS